MSYTVRTPSTSSNITKSITCYTYNTAMYYAIDFVVLQLYSIQEQVLSGKYDFPTNKKIIVFTLIDFIKDKRFHEALNYYNSNVDKIYKILIIKDSVRADMSIKKSDYIISDELINFANKLKKEVVFQ